MPPPPHPPPPPLPPQSKGAEHTVFVFARRRRCQRKTSCPFCYLNALLNILMKYGRYSITSMARTRMARLPSVIRTRFSVPTKTLPKAQENKYLGIFFFLFYHGIVCCVYSLESPHRGDSNEYIQHIIIV